MAEERKPKIDLKARLGKASGGAAPSPGGAAGGAIPVPQRGSRPPPAIPPPVLPGSPVGPPSPFGQMEGVTPAIDPSNPLAAVAAPYRPAPTPPPPAPTRIEVDEASVHAARAGGRKQGLVM